MTMLIHGGYLATMNAGRDVFEEGWIAVSAEGRIAALGPMATCPETPGRSFDARGMVVLPGLVDAYHPSWHYLVMGAVDMPASLGERDCAAELTGDDLWAAADMAAAEALAGGTSTMLVIAPPGQAGHDIASLLAPGLRRGLRQVLALDWLSWTEDAIEAALRDWHGAENGMVRVALRLPADVASVAAGRVRESDLAAAYRFAIRHDLRIVAETAIGDDGTEPMGWLEATGLTGRSTAVHLMELGLLDPRWLLVHGDHLDPVDVALMAEARCHAVCCPVADAMRGRPTLAWTQLARTQVNFALGSGGVALAGSADMIEQAKALVMIQNNLNRDPSAMSAETALEAATLGGAQALGLGEEIGALEVGKRADIAVFDLGVPQCQVANKPVSNLVSTARGSEARLVLVDGRIVHDGAHGTTVASAMLRARRAALLSRIKGE